MAKGWHLSYEEKLERFISKINLSSNDDCWEWQGFITPLGYGRYRWHEGRKNWLAHRLMYKLFWSDFNPALDICHHCDNTKCVNPFHLFQGTHADNMQDMKKKGRAVCPGIGIKNFNAKLNPEKVREIRKLRKEGWTIVKLGEKFGVNHSNISNVTLNKTWKHVA